MIITNLAASAYEGETDIAIALENIVAKMPNFVRTYQPRIPNPANPAEDYADKWSKDARLEKSFWEWYYAVKSDLARLPALLGGQTLQGDVEKMFDVTLTQTELQRLGANRSPSVVVKPAHTLVIPSAVRPWGR
jgi:hypothetical protein